MLYTVDNAISCMYKRRLEETANHYHNFKDIKLSGSILMVSPMLLLLVSSTTVTFLSLLMRFLVNYFPVALPINASVGSVSCSLVSASSGVSSKVSLGASTGVMTGVSFVLSPDAGSLLTSQRNNEK